VNLVLQLQDVELLGKQQAHRFEPLGRMDGRQHALALLDAEFQGGGDEVGQPARLVDVHGRHVGVVRE
jgi:hypothetical protein